MSLLLGLDIGTTATKALLLDTERGVVAVGERTSKLESPHPGWAEEDPRLWLDNVYSLCRELVPGGQVDAVGVTGMVPCVILLDAEGSPLRMSIQQNDARAVAEISALQETLSGNRILERTGSAITQQSVAPTILWLKRHEPDQYARARHVLGSYDFVNYALTGRAGVEANWALESGLYDFEQKRWAEDVADAVGFDLSLLGDIQHVDKVAGEMTRKASEATGIKAGTPVIGGAADHVASAFAAGTFAEDDLFVKLGGAGDILMSTTEPLIDHRLYLDFHVVPGMYMPNGCMATSGSAVRWFAAELACGVELGELDRAAAEAEPGSDGIVCLPYFLGEKTPLNDPEARAAFVGLHLGHTRAHMFRALLEGVAYGFRHHTDVFAELGHPPARVRAGDGGSKSTLWTQIISDVLEKPIQVVDDHGGAALGVAFAAGVVTGGIDGWDRIESFVQVRREVEPAPKAVYAAGYERYRRLYPKLKEALA
ncbi:MAG TPA: FGGY-family carbohydrate kinase [Candidatus Sulfotelmatobacter sp.]|nr:FGGY-family carbohydrate kinase [Candidatus Sulfotelmatobacter sp.]